LEIGVAATKTFVCQVAVMYLLGLRLAELRQTLPPERIAELVAEIKHLPNAIAELIRACGSRAEAIADTCWDSDFFLYIGRHISLPVALEGALNLKEISYISADAYAAGEMKHGPIALLDEGTPVVCVAPPSPAPSSGWPPTATWRSCAARATTAATGSSPRACCGRRGAGSACAAWRLPQSCPAMPWPTCNGCLAPAPSGSTGRPGSETVRRRTPRKRRTARRRGRRWRAAAPSSTRCSERALRASRAARSRQRSTRSTRRRPQS